MEEIFRGSKKNNNKNPRRQRESGAGHHGGQERRHLQARRLDTEVQRDRNLEQGVPQDSVNCKFSRTKDGGFCVPADRSPFIHAFFRTIHAGLLPKSGKV